MEYEILTRSLKDSAAHSKLKLLKEGEIFGVEKPGGEKRIHIGSMTEKNRWDRFFFPNGGQTFNVIVSKIDLIKYLFEAKDEYFNPKQSYRLKISDYYNSLYEQTKNIPLESFQICFEKNTDNSRYYLTRPSNNESSKNYKYIIDICLPIVTEYVFIRVKDDNSYLFYLKPEFRSNYITNDVITPDVTKKDSESKSSLQQIFYGAPGTGKSHIIKEQTKGEDVIRTTFHPDTDYSTFVGTYKPTTEFAPVLAIIGDKAVETGREEKRISYEFVSQAFLQAYVNAWKKVAEAQGGTPQKQFLVIEEINRGNCAQIFGDLFQLLDRNDFGYSDYPIKADADMQKQLKRLFEGVDITDADNINAMYNGRDIVEELLSGEVLLLPNNLYIWATMNTSDQSLFPIDSAFKRRWDWQYMPISEGRDKNGQSKNWKIEADTQMYSWWSFIQKINDEIYDKTNSEDKKLGYYFCKPINGVIRVETFVSKVLFYLWNDVFKDFDNESGIFAEPYDKFYGTGTRGEVLIAKDKVQTLLDNLHVEVAEIIGADENESASDESGNATTTGSSARDKSVYSINGEGNYVKKTVPLATVTAYVKNYPDVTASELVETWYALGTMIRQIVISKESYEQKLSKTSDAIFAKRYNSLNLPNGEVVYVYNQFTPERINDFISKVNEQSWDIHIEKVAE